MARVRYSTTASAKATIRQSRTCGRCGARWTVESTATGEAMTTNRLSPTPDLAEANRIARANAEEDASNKGHVCTECIFLSIELCEAAFPKGIAAFLRERLKHLADPPEFPIGSLLVVLAVLFLLVRIGFDWFVRGDASAVNWLTAGNWPGGMDGSSQVWSIASSIAAVFAALMTLASLLALLGYVAETRAHRKKGNVETRFHNLKAEELHLVVLSSYKEQSRHELLLAVSGVLFDWLRARQEPPVPKRVKQLLSSGGHGPAPSTLDCGKLLRKRGGYESRCEGCQSTVILFDAWWQKGVRYCPTCGENRMQDPEDRELRSIVDSALRESS